MIVLKLTNLKILGLNLISWKPVLCEYLSNLKNPQFCHNLRLYPLHLNETFGRKTTIIQGPLYMTIIDRNMPKNGRLWRQWAQNLTFKKEGLHISARPFLLSQNKYILSFRSFICRCLNLSKENPSKPHFLVICGLVIFWLSFFGLSPHFLVTKNLRVQLVFAFPMWYTAWKVSKYGVFSSPCFPVFGLNTELYSVNLRIPSEYRKIRTRKISVLGHFFRSDTVLNRKVVFEKQHTHRVFFKRKFWFSIIFDRVL